MRARREDGQDRVGFYLVPKTEGDPVRGPQGASPLNKSTWKNLPGVPISGAGAWTSATLDPTTGLLYVPGGNPAPDFDIGAREGRIAILISVVVLDAKTGAYRPISRLCPRIGTTGMSPTHPP